MTRLRQDGLRWAEVIFFNAVGCKTRYVKNHENIRGNGRHVELAVTAEQVRDLRDRTGAGMMDCKRALEEAGGDLEKAISILREKGLSTAAKKVGRIASEGLVAASVGPDKRRGTMVEVNCETDFVAKNEDFLAFVRDLAREIGEAGTLAETAMAEGETIKDLKLGAGGTVGERLTALVAKIGENMTVRRYARFSADDTGLVESYIHLGGKIGVLIQLACAKPGSASDPAVLGLAKDLAMQVAAARPEYIRREDVPAAVLDGERAIFKAQALNEGKPEHVAEKIVLGRVEKFYKDVCLMEQAYIKDPNQTVAQLVKAVAAGLGETISVVRFARFERGEGLAKKEHDLLADVQSQLKG